jgi:hypothetical protein
VNLIQLVYLSSINLVLIVNIISLYYFFLIYLIILLYYISVSFSSILLVKVEFIDNLSTLSILILL